MAYEGMGETKVFAGGKQKKWWPTLQFLFTVLLNYRRHRNRKCRSWDTQYNFTTFRLHTH
jgi:hypothetical protein